MTDFPTSLEAFLASSDSDGEDDNKQWHNAETGCNGHAAALPSLPARELLWESITKQVPKSEWPLMRHVLGEALLERNEDLKKELSSLSSILDDLLQHRNEQHRQRLEQERHKKMRHSITDSSTALPEPPMMEALKKDIQVFIASICRDPVAQQEPGVLEKVIRPQSARERAVLEYTTGISPSESASPLSGLMVRSNASTPTPTTTGPRPSSASVHMRRATVGAGGYTATRDRTAVASQANRPLSAASQSSHSSSVGRKNAGEVVTEVAEFLHVDGIDSVVSHLRQALEAERDALLEDIDVLHLMLDEEMNAAGLSPAPISDSGANVVERAGQDDEVELENLEQHPPSVTELRNFSARIKQEWKISKERTAQLEMLHSLPAASDRNIRAASRGLVSLEPRLQARPRSSLSSGAASSAQKQQDKSAQGSVGHHGTVSELERDADIRRTPHESAMDNPLGNSSLGEEKLAPTPPRHPKPAPRTQDLPRIQKPAPVAGVRRRLHAQQQGRNVHVSAAMHKSAGPSSSELARVPPTAVVFSSSKTEAKLRALGLSSHVQQQRMRRNSANRTTGDAAAVNTTVPSVTSAAPHE